VDFVTNGVRLTKHDKQKAFKVVGSSTPNHRGNCDEKDIC
jgi:hypothetical protein